MTLASDTSSRQPVADEVGLRWPFEVRFGRSLELCDQAMDGGGIPSREICCVVMAYFNAA